MNNKLFLKESVEDFKAWRKANFTEEEIVLNIVDDVSYPEWEKLQSFFSDLITKNEISQLDYEDKVNLLYLAARGWDCGGFFYELSEQKPISSCGDLTDKDFIEIGKVAISLTGIEFQDAKSQIAICFRKLDYLSEEIETILLSLYNENDEYIKRQSLFSLAKLGYKNINELIDKSWLIDNEWHKIGCLQTIDTYLKDELMLKKFISEVSNDKRKDLREYVKQLTTQNNC